MEEYRVVISPGRAGLHANIIGSWSDEILIELQGRDIRTLGLCAIDWADLSPLTPIASSVLELSLVSADTSSEGLQAFSNLLVLNIDSPIQPAIDFSKLHQLVKSRLCWTKELAKHPIDSLSIEELELLYFDAPDCSSLRNVKALKRLDIRQGNLRSLAGIGALNNLEHLSLTGMRSLSDISDLSMAKHLASLHISKCHKISNLRPLSELGRLARLEIDMLRLCQRDINWMSCLVSAEHIINGTQVESIDWAMILSLPKLRQFSTHTHPGYEISDDEILQIAQSSGRTISRIKRYPNKLGQGVELFFAQNA